MEFTSVKDKLAHINKNEKEPFLFPILKQLFLAKKYDCVEIIHGINEYGKDLVFKEYNSKLGNERWYSVVVKNKNASMEDFEDGGEITRQIKLSFQHPFLDSNGNEHYINSVIVIVNGSISQQAKSVLNKVLTPHFRSNVDIWNYQKLEEEISKEIKDLFLSENGTSKDDIVYAKYKIEQIKRLSDLENAKDIYTKLDIFEINDIFVNIRTSMHKYQDEKNRYQDEKQKIREELDDSIAIINSNKNTLIKGVATSGKSLLMKRIGVNVLNSTKEKNDAVFYFKFRKLCFEPDIDLNVIINEQFKELTGGEDFERSYFQKLILLFDGIDELKTIEAKKSIMTIINNYIDDNKGGQLQVIISGRNIEMFDGNLFDSFEKISLLPFDVGQAFALVKKLIPNDKTKAANFISAIKSNQLSNSLTRTPMALTLAAILYREDEIDLEEIPANITELYNKFCDYYLNRWDVSKGLSLQYKFEETKHILAFIAKHMHENNMQEIPRDKLMIFLQKLKSTHPIEDLSDIEQFMNNLNDRVGLIHFNESEQTFGFCNLSFQEYFASIFFDDSNEQFLIDNLYKEWWENSIIFYCGKTPKRDVFIKKIISSKIPFELQNYFQHISILSKTIQAAHLIPKETQRNIISNIIYNFDKLYKGAIESDIIKNIGKERKEQSGLTISLTTLDIILQFRKMFEKLFQTKHIDLESFSDISLDILTKPDGFSDVTLYSISYLLSHKMNDPIFLSEFIKNEKLNTRWNRIVFVDIEYLKLKQKVNIDLFRRIKRKQEHNSKYINKQFKEPAILHIIDGQSYK